MISEHYDHDQRHFRFSRSHTGDLEATEPLSGYGWELLRLAGIAVCCAFLWLLAWCCS